MSCAYAEPYWRCDGYAVCEVDCEGRKDFGCGDTADTSEYC